jgi:hypothetical protein
VPVQSGGSVVPASEAAAARAQIAQLQRMPGKKTMEAEILVKRSRSPVKSVDCALAVIGQGRLVKTVCAVLGVARSNVIHRLARPADWVVGRTIARLDPVADAITADAVRAEIAALPT